MLYADLWLGLLHAHLRLRHPNNDLRLRNVDGHHRRGLTHNDLRLGLPDINGWLRLVDGDLGRRLVDRNGWRRLLDHDLGRAALLLLAGLSLTGLCLCLSFLKSSLASGKIRTLDEHSYLLAGNQGLLALTSVELGNQQIAIFSRLREPGAGAQRRCGQHSTRQ